MFSGAVDTHVMKLFAGCDGRHRLRELVAEIAKRVDADFEPVAAICAAVVKKLLLAGLLEAM